MFVAASSVADHSEVKRRNARNKPFLEVTAPNSSPLTGINAAAATAGGRLTSHHVGRRLVAFTLEPGKYPDFPPRGEKARDHQFRKESRKDRSRPAVPPTQGRSA